LSVQTVMPVVMSAIVDMVTDPCPGADVVGSSDLRPHGRGAYFVLPVGGNQPTLFDRLVLDQPGRTLVRVSHRPADQARSPQKRPVPRKRRPRLDRAVEHQPRAIRVEEDRRRDPRLPRQISTTNFRRRTLGPSPCGAPARWRLQRNGGELASLGGERQHILPDPKAQ
jgi:hypothetical protein